MSSQKIIKEIKKLTWEPHDMPLTPYLVFYVLEAAAKGLKMIIGDCYHHLAVYSANDNGRWGFTEEDFERLGNYVFDKARRNKRLLRELELKSSQAKREVREIIREIDKSDLKTLPARQLAGLFSKFYSAFVRETAVPALANVLDYQSQKQIKTYFKERKTTKSDLARYLTILNAPNRLSYTTVERQKLSGIAHEIFINTKLKSLFKKEDAKTIIARLKDFSAISRKINNHAREYFWILNNYAQATVLGADYFIVGLKKILQFNSDPILEIKQIEQGLKKAKIEKKRLVAKLRLNKDLLLLIKLLEHGIYWRDERKKYNQIADHYHMLFIKETVRRFSIGLGDLKYIFPSELIKLLRGGSFDRNSLRVRRASNLIIYTPAKLCLFTGKFAKQLNDRLYKTTKIKTGLIQGDSACLGKVRGEVRVIMGPNDFKKMKPGCILVTSMTRPEFVPVMKLAKGIVTDEGGITCHAAIISRELGIPCIIGTRVATKVFKDGDKVEVDAEKGEVRKI